MHQVTDRIASHRFQQLARPHVNCPDVIMVCIMLRQAQQQQIAANGLRLVYALSFWSSTMRQPTMLSLASLPRVVWLVEANLNNSGCPPRLLEEVGRTNTNESYSLAPRSRAIKILPNGCTMDPVPGIHHRFHRLLLCLRCYGLLELDA
jgi:hypothetical protein